MTDKNKIFANRLLILLILIISALTVGMAFFLNGSLVKIEFQNETIENLKETSKAQENEISLLLLNITNLNEKLSISEGQLRTEIQTRKGLEDELMDLKMIARNKYWVLAADENKTNHYIPLEVGIKDGKNALIINAMNLTVDEAFRASAMTAVKVAGEVTKTSLKDIDVLININSPETGLSIQDESGAITLTAIASMQAKKIRKNVLIIGTINEDHTIGQVGSIREKALAAKENGASLILLPEGQKNDIGNVDIEFREVKNIEDAVRYAIIQQ